MELKQKQLNKNEKKSSASPRSTKSANREKRKATLPYFVGASIFLISILSFFLFSPFTLPIFSQFGDKILGREEKVKGVEKVIEQKKEDDHDIVVENEGVPAEEKMEEIEEPSTPASVTPKIQPKSTESNTIATQDTAPTSPSTSETIPTPKPPQPVVPKCSDDKMASIQADIALVSYSKQFVNNYVVNESTFSSIWRDLRNANLYSNSQIEQKMSYYGNLLSQINQEGGVSGAWRTGTFIKLLQDIQKEWLLALSREYSKELSSLNNELYYCKE